VALLLLPAIICLTGGGCVRGTRSAPDLTYLDVDPGPALETLGISPEVLLLRRLDVASPFDDRRFIYKTAPGTYESDYYVRFVAPPAELLTERLEAWLSESGLFGAVVEPGSSVDFRYVLEGELQELFGDYSNPQQPEAVIQAEFVLVDDLEGAGKVIFKRQYRHTEPVNSSGGKAVAASWRIALRSILLELSTDLRSHLAQSGGQ
jgi:ABC-type uncharacterized transport system auxiliary subunit